VLFSHRSNPKLTRRLELMAWGTIIAACVCLVAPAAVPTLVAHWPLDEGAGAVATDATGNGNTGAISGASWVELGEGSMLHFDGLDDLVNCG
jgi:hypothetical protein